MDCQLLCILWYTMINYGTLLLLPLVMLRLMVAAKDFSHAPTSATHHLILRHQRRGTLFALFYKAPSPPCASYRTFASKGPSSHGRRSRSLTVVDPG